MVTRPFVQKLISVKDSLRPKQWIKNLLVFAAPIAGANLGSHIFSLTLTFVIFCFASSIGYIFNDWTDRNSDALNPKKKDRPFASRSLGQRSAVLISSLLFLGLIILLTIAGSPSLIGLILSYLIITISYSKWLKEIPVVEIIVVAGCFVIRSLAGGLTGHSALSQWFFAVIAFGAVLIVSAKRLAELLQGSGSRGVLKDYSETFLRSIMTIGASGALFGFSLWTFNVEQNSVYAQISFVPFIIFILRLFWVLDKGETHRSENFPIQDPVIRIALILLVFSLFVTVYG